MESLSAGAKLLYDILRSETDKIYEAKLASYLAAEAAARSTMRSTAALRVPSGTASGEPATATPIAVSASPVSTTTPPTSDPLNIAKDDLTLESQPICKHLVGGSAAVASASCATRSATTTPTTPAVSNLILSFERATTDDSSPEARRLNDLLIGGSASPTPTVSSRAPSRAIPTG
jgi:hypothetical protein